MHLFGLTGGIASGKSAVAARFRARGLPVIDADAVAREVVEPGSDALGELVQEFGPEVLLPDGTLDRKSLAARAFADDASRERLNAITHPRISTLTMQRGRELAASGAPLACYEAALIVENGLAEAFRPLVVVAATEALQVVRAQTRDGGSADDARARIRAQTPLADKVKLADHVIDNRGSLAELVGKADAVLDAICASFGIDPGRYPKP